MRDPVLNMEAEKLIWVAEPWLGEEEANAVHKSVLDNWISQGPRVKEFEQKVANATGKRFGSACNSGTTALHLALHVCDIKPGDEVIVPNLTMIALANAVLLTGAKPVFVDSSPSSQVGNVRLYEIAKQVTPLTKAVILVHTYGEPVEDLDLIIRFCRDKGIKVIEDCAESHFGKYQGAPLGSFGDLAIFSFYSNKNITTGEGGMVTTDIEWVKHRLDRVRMHAFTPGQHFCHTERAFGYRMTDMQAAVGLEQLKKAEVFMKIRKNIRSMYEVGLSDLPYIEIPKTTEESAWWVMPILAKDKRERDELRQHLADRGIDTRTYFQPMNEQQFLTCFSQGEYPVSKGLADRGLYLPLYPKLQAEDISYIIRALREY